MSPPKRRLTDTDDADENENDGVAENPDELSYDRELTSTFNIDIHGGNDPAISVYHDGPTSGWSIQIPIKPTDFYRADDPVQRIWFNSRQGTIVAEYDRQDAVFDPQSRTWSFYESRSSSSHTSRDTHQLLWSFDREQDAVSDAMLGVNKS